LLALALCCSFWSPFRTADGRRFFYSAHAGKGKGRAGGSCYSVQPVGQLPAARSPTLSTAQNRIDSKTRPLSATLAQTPPPCPLPRAVEGFCRDACLSFGASAEAGTGGRLPPLPTMTRGCMLAVSYLTAALPLHSRPSHDRRTTHYRRTIVALSSAYVIRKH
jgi:hypothetical protein